MTTGSRLAAFLAAGLVTVATSAGAAVAPPERPRVSGLAPGIDLTSPEALGWTREQHETAMAYSRGAWTLGFVDPIVSMACLALLSLSGFAGWLARTIASRLRSRLASDSISIVALVTCLAALNFPMEIYRFHRERAYGFATQDLPSWLADEMKGLAVVWVIALAFLLPVWAAIRRWPRRWWIAGSAIGVALSVMLIAVAPVFIAPLFNTFTRLQDDSLRERILALARKEGIPAEDVYEVDASRQSRHDNAYVVGLLGTQRIVLYDTLIQAYTPEEIEFVMGHEMGHYVMSHVWKGVAVASVATLVGFFLLHRGLGRVIAAQKGRLGYDSVGAIASVPLALLMLSGYLFVIGPATSAISRRFEHQADVFALNTVEGTPGGRGVAVSSFQKMAARNLTNPNPPAFIEWWLYSHPSIGRRIRFCAGQREAVRPLRSSGPGSAHKRALDSYS